MQGCVGGRILADPDAGAFPKAPCAHPLLSVASSHVWNADAQVLFCQGTAPILPGALEWSLEPVLLCNSRSNHGARNDTLGALCLIPVCLLLT